MDIFRRRYEGIMEDWEKFGYKADGTQTGEQQDSAEPNAAAGADGQGAQSSASSTAGDSGQTGYAGQTYSGTQGGFSAGTPGSAGQTGYTGQAGYTGYAGQSGYGAGNMNGSGQSGYAGQTYNSAQGTFSSGAANYAGQTGYAGPGYGGTQSGYGAGNMNGSGQNGYAGSGYGAQGGYQDGGMQAGGQAEQQPPKKKTKTKEKKYVTRRMFVVCLIVAMVCSAAIGAAAYALSISVFGGTSIDKSINTTNYNLSTNTGSPLSIQEIAARNENSVVAIDTESVATDSWLGQYVTQGAGSGVIYSEDGYIVTNNHVIEDASTIKVTLHDGTQLDATLVATDEQTDVAVIKVEKDGLIPVSIGDSSALNVGDLSVAIGNPLGRLAGSTSEGIISGLEREITLDGRTMVLIQTTASISPGNSGGGLFDQYGKLIGIVVAKSADSDAEGLGFAIPVNLVKKVADSLIENGYVADRPAAGITILDLTDASQAMQYGVRMTGVYISQVNGKNAEKSGLQAGDMIYYLDETRITSGSQLISLIQTHEIGDTVTFTVVRNNEMLNFDLELEDAQSVNQYAASHSDEQQQWPNQNQQNEQSGGFSLPWSW